MGYCFRNECCLSLLKLQAYSNPITEKEQLRLLLDSETVNSSIPKDNTGFTVYRLPFNGWRWPYTDFLLILLVGCSAMRAQY